MKASVLDRVYPRELQPSALKEHARFWLTLLRKIVRRESLAQLRTYFVMDAPSFIRTRLWARHLTPSSNYSELPLSGCGRQQLATLRRDGIVKCHRGFPELARYVRDRYLSDTDALPADSPLRQNGLSISHAISFSDTRLHELFFDAEICALVCNYYGRQGYYRDNPTVHKEHWSAGHVPPVSGVFHADGYRQISFMLILADATEANTHMEFAKGSHAVPQPTYDRNRIDQAAVLREYAIEHVVGPAGTLYIFDTEALHRGTRHPESGREMLHVNITTGMLPFTNQRYAREADIFANPDEVPQYVRSFVAGAIARS